MLTAILANYQDFHCMFSCAVDRNRNKWQFGVISRQSDMAANTKCRIRCTFRQRLLTHCCPLTLSIAPMHIRAIKMKALHWTMLLISLNVAHMAIYYHRCSHQLELWSVVELEFHVVPLAFHLMVSMEFYIDGVPAVVQSQVRLVSHYYHLPCAETTNDNKQWMQIFSSFHKADSKPLNSKAKHKYKIIK